MSDTPTQGSTTDGQRPPSRDEDDAPFRDAESFLADLGVERRPIVVRVDPEDTAATLTEAASPLVGHAPDATVAPDQGRLDDRAEVAHHPGPPVSVQEAVRVATEAPPPEVEAALSFLRRSTAAQPASEGRLRSRLRDRGYDQDVVEEALGRARQERLVDDDALSAAMVAEWRAKGHAPRKLRQDLRRRGFDEDVVERAVGRAGDHDQGAAAFDLARRRAESLAHLPPETAFRRVVGYVARRGYGDGLARKAARDAVYDQRDDERVSGR